MKTKYIMPYIAILSIIYGSTNGAENEQRQTKENNKSNSSQPSSKQVSFYRVDTTPKLNKDNNLLWIRQFILDTLFDIFLEKIIIADNNFYKHKTSYHKELKDFDYPKNHPLFALMNYEVKNPFTISYVGNSYGDLYFSFIPKPKNKKKKVQTTLSFRGLTIPDYLEDEIKVDSSCANTILGHLRTEDRFICFKPVKYSFDPVYQLDNDIYAITVTMSIMRDSEVSYIAEKITTLYLQVK